MPDGGNPESSEVRPDRQVINYGHPKYAVGYTGYGRIDLIREQLRNNGGPDETVFRMVGESGTRYTVSMQSGLMMIQNRGPDGPIGNPTFEEVDIDRLRYVTLGEPCPWIPGGERVRSLLMSAYAGAVQREPNIAAYTGKENPLIQEWQLIIEEEAKRF